jgi:predicted RNA-binding protein
VCQATVYLDEQEIMEDVIWLKPTADGFLLKTFFGEPKEVKGTIEGIDFLKHRVLLTSQDRLPRGSER